MCAFCYKGEKLGEVVIYSKYAPKNKIPTVI